MATKWPSQGRTQVALQSQSGPPGRITHAGSLITADTGLAELGTALVTVDLILGLRASCHTFHTPTIKIPERIRAQHYSQPDTLSCSCPSLCPHHGSDSERSRSRDSSPKTPRAAGPGPHNSSVVMGCDGARLRRADPVVQQALKRALVLRRHVREDERGPGDLEAARRGDGLGVEQPGDVCGRVSRPDAGETGGGAARDVLVGRALGDGRGLCGGEEEEEHRHHGVGCIAPPTPPPPLSCVSLTENIHSVVGAGHRAPPGLGGAGVAPLVGPRHGGEGQVVVPSLARRPRRDLLAVPKPRGCRRGASRHDALQRQRLRLLHRDGQRGGGVHHPHRGGGVRI
ncbi:hypothetical protein EYF80_023182 [Liparis tanakae]|uniref:Uncharacterized protein n=1 Tax=Liparis tanakae TaxID=230148 RepID=A0A4Z2HLB2_9TELE|nr:hypothetical protein EYF80_023182 [Liparis tanakae]